MPKRVIAIGDVHGCSQELEQLLDKLAPTADDQLIFLGDLVNKGPDSVRVLDIAQRSKAVCLLGNHERRLRNYRRFNSEALLKKDDFPTLEKLSQTHWDFLETLKLTHEASSHGTVFVHGGFLPDRPWQEQEAGVVTRIQVIDKQGRPRKRSECSECPSWADSWKGPPFVIYGHTPREEVYRSPWALGIDTGCVYGGHLSACILPERSILQVRARKTYCST